MSSATSAELQAVAHYIQTWADVFSQTLAEITQSPLPCAVLGDVPSEVTAASETDLSIIAASSGTLRGELSLRLTASSTLQLAKFFMGEMAAAATEVTAEHREAVLELLRQVGGLAASSFKATYGELQIHLDAAPAAPSWPPSDTAWLRIGEDPAKAVLIEIQLSAALAAGLRTGREESPAPLPDPVAPPLETAPPPPHDEKVNLDLLMNVELAVTLRFGSRELLLREVLDLIPGSVVDLDRQVHDPVDMLLDGRVIARGEVVVMDGNYGLRVTEVAPAT